MPNVRATYQFDVQPKMTEPTNDVVRQARQGSVAAIIQVLNEKLADSGVRTRAILADSILQLLCEAATVEQLEQAVLTERIQQILEAITPRNIRRVKINSRIVREQQLLWLEEINRDPENQLLWAEEITLKRSNLFKQFTEDFRGRQTEPPKPDLPKSAHRLREQRQFWRGILGGASLSLVLVLLGWTAYARFSPQWIAGTKPTDSNSSTSPTLQNTSAQPQASAVTANQPAQVPSSSDPFVEAVRMAEQAAATGKEAQLPAQWLDLAAKWQKASDLMGAVPPTDSRYQTAQDRTNLYRKNSEAALQEATKRRTPTDNPAPAASN